MSATRTARLAPVAALAALAFAAPSPAAAQSGDTLVIARDMDVNSLDPARAFCDTCQIFLTATYEKLVDLAPDNRTIVPMLAESWEVNDDQTVFTFTLHADAVFADGSPVEASDVKWSLERLADLKGNPSFLMDGVAAVEAPDARTVVIRTASPNSEILGILAAPYASVVNRELAEANGATAGEGADATDQAETWFLANSAGSGPYVLDAYAPDDEMRLERNEAYWREPAPISTVVFRQVKDSVTQAQMLQSAAADIAMQVDADTAASLAGNPDVTVESIPSFNFVYVGLGAGARDLPIEMTRTVREAIALAIDYEGAIDLIVAGEGRPQAAPIPNGFPGTAGLKPTTRDLDRARALLAEAGHADGFTLEAIYPSVNVYGVDFNLLMQKIQQDLSEVGIQLELQPVTFAVWRERITDRGIGLTAVYYAPDYFGSGQYVSFFGTQPGSPWHTRSHAATSPDAENPALAEMLQAALSAPADKAEAIFAEIGAAMMNDRVILPILSPNLVLAHRANVEGVRYSACCNLPLAEISFR
jgi:peptide/nickel transport system substrate-binding protein